jgi:hypothetical protein
MKEITQFKINAFLVGAQKSATTSLYSWISQHPQVCAPMSMKDFPYFAKDAFFNLGHSLIHKEYENDNLKAQKVNIQGSVSYMFYPFSIKRIYNYNPEAKIIMVLRHPIQRAISAYQYFVKMQRETESFDRAVQLENIRMQSNDFIVKSDLTYLHHGLYGRQLNDIYEVFPRNQVLVLLYDDLKDNPLEVTKRIFHFLRIEPNFEPDLLIKNRTGKVKYPWIQKAVFGQNWLRKRMVSLINPILPLHKRTRIRLFLRDWNTESNSKSELEVSDTTYHLLRDFFQEDIVLLEGLTGFDLSKWKK